MPKSFEQAQTISEYISDLVKRRALKAIADHDAVLARQYEVAAARIRRELRASGFSIQDVKRIVEAAFRDSFQERTRAVAEAIKAAAREARVLDDATFKAVFGDDKEAAAAPRPFAASTPARVRSLSRRKESADK